MKKKEKIKKEEKKVGCYPRLENVKIALAYV